MTRVPVRWPAKNDVVEDVPPDPAIEWTRRAEAALGRALGDMGDVARLEIRVIADVNDDPWFSVSTPPAVPGAEVAKYFVRLSTFEAAADGPPHDGFDGLERLLALVVNSTPFDELTEAFPALKVCAEDADVVVDAILQPLYRQLHDRVFRELINRQARGVERDNLAHRASLLEMSKSWLLDLLVEKLREARPRIFENRNGSEKPSKKATKNKSRKRKPRKN